MKRIVLTASGDVYKTKRFIVEYDEDLGEAQIVDESAPRIERGRTAMLGVEVGLNVDGEWITKHGSIRLAVEVAP
ncbi:MAG TPA: hypothetical protein VGL61_25730 [Kofleriaceae bacterium]|jgi:hypothetical protein